VKNLDLFHSYSLTINVGSIYFTSFMRHFTWAVAAFAAVLLSISKKPTPCYERKYSDK
jgi:hypothetical protein